MPKLKQLLFDSVMNYVYLSVLTIITITLLSIFFSFWITDKTENDAGAINLAGSMRMQTFQIGLALHDSPQQVEGLVERLDNTWNMPLLTQFQAQQFGSAMSESFTTAYRHWLDILKPRLKNFRPDSSPYSSNKLYPLLVKQVALTDTMVNQLQGHAEGKIKNLRALELFVLLLVTLAGCLIFYLLKHRVEEPLSQLTEAAIGITQGKLQQHLNLTGGGELAQLGQAFNRMSTAISENHHELEARVESRTIALQRNIDILEFLFRIVRNLLSNPSHELNYQQIIAELSVILGRPELELCLSTAQGDNPYLQVNAACDKALACDKTDCSGCKGDGPFDLKQVVGVHHNYPIIEHNTQYGVLQLRSKNDLPLEAWQDQLLRSTANQFAVALSLKETKEQERRLAMLNERTVIARELHDSLAQSLSYLKIQVTRLQKNHDRYHDKNGPGYQEEQAIVGELREGLSAAYRHLRELLTTFRLKLDSNGLEGGLTQTVATLEQRSSMHVTLAFELNNVPLNPNEEIHLLQIAREASQNAINHSRGTKLMIHLFQNNDQSIELWVTDDGIGFQDEPQKLNHYGLNIMQERSKQLGGSLQVHDNIPQGTAVKLRFQPAYLQNAA